MYVYVYVCIVYVCMCVCMYTCVYVCIVYVCMHVCVYVCIVHVCMCVGMHVCMYVYMYALMYICVRACVCVCVYVCVNFVIYKHENKNDCQCSKRIKTHKGLTFNRFYLNMAKQGTHVRHMCLLQSNKRAWMQLAACFNVFNAIQAPTVPSSNFEQVFV